MNKPFIERFGVPEAAFPVIGQIVTAEEQAAVTAAPESFGAEGFAAYNTAFVEKAYRRGIFNIIGEDNGLYAVGSFYGRLDVFAISEPEIYRTFPVETQKALDAWYFETYAGRLDKTAEKPTSDVTLTTEEIIERIENDGRQLYLAPCDCRSLTGFCGKPALTCLSYRNGINSFAHRGHSRPISKEEGKRVVLEAAGAGLVHTANEAGYCNCCKDCCYLFRAKKTIGKKAGRWLSGVNQAEVDGERCVSCGICETQCPVDAITLVGGVAQVDKSLCVGCGRCLGCCNVGAIKFTVN